MVEDRLNSSLLNIGYQRLDSNAQGIYLYYRVLEKELVIIPVIRVLKGDELTAEQYHHILEQMEESFHKSYPQRIRLLSLILTGYPDRVKQFCSNSMEESHWIIDVSTGRLIIYETQAGDFGGLRDMLEQLLEEEQMQNGQDMPTDTGYNPYYASEAPDRQGSSRTLQFTLINTILIAANLAAYAFTHFTGAFGGADEMYIKGALSWYFVTEGNEYYRLLTSMFMHADGSHLFNNMLVLLFIGSSLERAVGKVKYIFLYFGTGIVAGLVSIGYNMWKENGIVPIYRSTFSIGASGAIFGTTGAIFYVVAINRGRLEEISLRQIIIFVILSLYSGITNAHIDQAAHIGGFLSGVLLAALMYRRARNKAGTEKQSTQV